MKLEDIRIAVETDPEILAAYRSHREGGHIEVFSVLDLDGGYETTLLFDANAETWTIEPDEIWASDFPDLMTALRFFCDREEEEDVAS